MTDSDPDSIINLSHSGGADLNAGRDINVGGDVIGRDKIESHTATNTASVTGSGTVVQGDGSVAAGAGGVAVKGDVHGDISVTSITDAQQHDVRGLANPYLGLQSFTYADHAKYAGREKLIAETVARLTAPDDPLSLLFVTGASGSGKSSFVQAGVLPELEKHYAALGVKWAVFRPSRDPLVALADALWRQLGLPQFDAHTASPADFGDFLKTHTPAQQVNVIVIDQFEELFTQSSTQPRDAFFALLTQLPPFRSTHTHIIATVRADYLPELFALPALYDIAKHGIDLRVMSVDKLREAIQQPLRAAYPDNNKRFQAELVERLAQNAAEDAAYLPLLQVTLEEIWRKGTLTLGSYTNLADAIKQRADKVLAYQDYDVAQPNQLRSPEEQAAILNLCLDLVDVSLDDEARRDVRRRRSKDELTSGAPERARLIDTLTQARLLSVGTESGEQPHVEVDLIHETLLSNWDRLRQAIAERRHELRQRVRFEQQLKEWIGQDRSDDYLLTGVRLAEARDLESRGDIALHNVKAKDFVRRSVTREEARQQKELDDARRLAESEKKRAKEQAQSAAKLRHRAMYLTLAFVVALIFGGVAIFFGTQSNQNAITAEHNAAEAGRNAATAQAASTLAVANAATAQAANTKSASEVNSRATAESIALAQRDEAQRQSNIAFLRQLGAQSVAHLSDQFDLAGLLSLETRRLAYILGDTFEDQNSLLRFVEQSPQLTAFMQSHTSSVNSIAFSPDGKILASGCDDGSVILWDTVSRQRLDEPLLGHAHVVWSVAFSPDGQTLASGDEDGTVILWDVVSHQQLGKISSGHSGAVYSIAFNSNGKLFASGGGDKTIVLWDTASRRPVGKPLAGHTGSVYSMAFSPDGKTLASGSEDGNVILWDVANERPSGNPLTGHTGYVYSVAFSPDGKTLASGGDNGSVVLWNTISRQQLGKPLLGHSRPIFSVAFSPDGRTLASGGDDSSIILWDVVSRQRLGEPLLGHSGSIWSVTFSPDGQTLASGGSNGSIILWNATGRSRLGDILTSQTDTVWSVAFSPNGEILAAGNNNGSVILWDMVNRQPIRELIAERNSPVYSVAFSPDGKILASGHDDGSVILWNMANYQQLAKPLTGHTRTVWSVAFSPDGRVLASASGDSTVILWDVASRQRLGGPLSGHVSDVFSVAFSPDGNFLASGSNDGKVILWNVASRQQWGEPLTGHINSVYSVSFSPDGKILASGGWDDKIILWDVASHQPLGEPLTGHTNSVFSVDFSPDGKVLASSSADGKVILWNVASRQRLGGPLIGHISEVYGVTFGPDGKTLASGDYYGTIMLWDVDPVSWQTRACQIVGRNLTRAEWQQYMGNEPYRKTCAQWSLEPEVTPTPASAAMPVR